VRLPDATDWLPFRDVYEVDARPVRDRTDRLTKLFLEPGPTSARQAAAITDESARYNIGVTRTVNHPLLGFNVLRASQQYRFHFGTPKADDEAGPGGWVIDYREFVRPSIIHGSRNRDVLMRGRVWIQADTGQVLRTDVQADAPDLTASIVVRFRLDPTFGLAVPAEMHEDYRQPGGTRVTGTATYGQFRQFAVEVSDDVKAAPRR